MSQTELADRQGLSFQQIQKYERGASRISASRLWNFSQLLGVPVGWFFEGIEQEPATYAGEITKRETLNLIRYFRVCPPALKRRILTLIQTFAS